MQRVQLVVKNRGFDVVLGSADNQIDFRKGRVSGSLCFQSSGSVIEQQKGEPCLFSFTPAKNGETCNVDCKISILSSQMQHSLFVIKFLYNEDCLVTEPFRVVSKKSQLEKSQTRKRRTRTTQVATREAVLSMIDQMKANHDHIMQRFESLENCYDSESFQAKRGRKRVRDEEETEDETDLQSAFRSFMDIYNRSSEAEVSDLLTANSQDISSLGKRFKIKDQREIKEEFEEFRDPTFQPMDIPCFDEEYIHPYTDIDYQFL